MTNNNKVRESSAYPYEGNGPKTDGRMHQQKPRVNGQYPIQGNDPMNRREGPEAMRSMRAEPQRTTEDSSYPVRRDYPNEKGRRGRDHDLGADPNRNVPGPSPKRSTYVGAQSDRRVKSVSEEPMQERRRDARLGSDPNRNVPGPSPRKSAYVGAQSDRKRKVVDEEPMTAPVSRPAQKARPLSPANPSPLSRSASSTAMRQPTPSALPSRSSPTSPTSPVRESSAYPYEADGPLKGGDPRVRRANANKGSAAGPTYAYDGTDPLDRKPNDIPLKKGGTSGNKSLGDDGPRLATLGPGPQPGGDPAMNRRAKAQMGTGKKLSGLGTGPLQDPRVHERSSKNESVDDTRSLTERPLSGMGGGPRTDRRMHGGPTQARGGPGLATYGGWIGHDHDDYEGDGSGGVDVGEGFEEGVTRNQNYAYGEEDRPNRGLGWQGKRVIKNSEFDEDVEMHAGKDYAYTSAGGWKKKNPAMDRYAEPRYQKGSDYAYTAAGGWKKSNPAMNERVERLREMKAKLESQINRLRETKHKMNESKLSFLIENEMQKAELILAAKSITEKLQKMAEDLAIIGPKELMPVADSMKTAFGLDQAQRFHDTTTQQLNALTGALTKAKDTIGSQIAQLEGSVAGAGPANDMNADPMGMGAGMDASANDMSMGAGGMGAGGMGDEMGGEMGAGDAMGGGGDLAGLEGGGDELAGAGAGPGAGGGGEMEPGAGGGEELGGEPPLGADAKSGLGRAKKESAHRHGRVVENRNVRRLRESRNPDALVLNAFRNCLRESGRAAVAAKRVAEAFEIDFEDVVSIVREAKKGGSVPPQLRANMEKLMAKDTPAEPVKDAAAQPVSEEEEVDEDIKVRAGRKGLDVKRNGKDARRRSTKTKEVEEDIKIKAGKKDLDVKRGNNKTARRRTTGTKEVEEAQQQQRGDDGRFHKRERQNEAVGDTWDRKRKAYDNARFDPEHNRDVRYTRPSKKGFDEGSMAEDVDVKKK